MGKVHDKFPSAAAMIALDLQPSTIVTNGDTFGRTAVLSCGVLRGASSSPTLYNVGTDSYQDMMERNPGDEADVTLFADNVKIQSNKCKGLQKRLGVST